MSAILKWIVILALGYLIVQFVARLRVDGMVADIKAQPPAAKPAVQQPPSQQDLVHQLALGFQDGLQNRRSQEGEQIRVEEAQNQVRFIYQYPRVPPGFDPDEFTAIFREDRLAKFRAAACGKSLSKVLLDRGLTMAHIVKFGNATQPFLSLVFSVRDC